MESVESALGEFELDVAGLVIEGFYDGPGEGDGAHTGEIEAESTEDTGEANVDPFNSEFSIFFEDDVVDSDETFTRDVDDLFV